jgi:S-adenosylmethionine:tRNA ribosyltransferase-isomerase
MLAQTRGQPKPGEVISIDGTELNLTLVRREERSWFLRPNLAAPASELLHRYGHIPLPPYIRKGRDEREDRTRYQTVYAASDGSIAAPTAGLHFTEELFAALTERGIDRSAITLHVGLGTFEPIRSDDPREHRMHREWCTVTTETVAEIETTRTHGNRVVAVGSTSLRTLESAARTGKLQPYTGETDLYIYPPYTFKVADACITNFHLPKSTLLLLVSAFAGEEMTREAYRVAVREEYRFFSYGDAMLIV